ncbi:MAG TPA: hypothetical protein VJ789_14970 [Burkholderiales bacterium]|nr:hypothetical protein [Burkholderiales bacterium]
MKARDVMTSPVITVAPETTVTASCTSGAWWTPMRNGRRRVAAENVPGVRGVEDHRFLSCDAPTMT